MDRRLGTRVALRSVRRSRGRREGREVGRVPGGFGCGRLVEGAEDGGGGRDRWAEVASAAALFKVLRNVPRRRDRERGLGGDRIGERKSRRRRCFVRSRSFGVVGEVAGAGRGAPFARENGWTLRCRDVFESELGRGKGGVLDTASLEAGKGDGAVENDDAFDRGERSSFHAVRR